MLHTSLITDSIFCHSLESDGSMSLVPLGAVIAKFLSPLNEKLNVKFRSIQRPERKNHSGPKSQIYRKFRINLASTERSSSVAAEVVVCFSQGFPLESHSRVLVPP